MARGPIKGKPNRQTSINPNNDSGDNCPPGQHKMTNGQCMNDSDMPGGYSRGRNRGKNVNASSVADVDRIVRNMQQEKIPGTNEPKWLIFPQGGTCAAYTNMCYPSCPSGMFTVGYCSAECTNAWGTDEEIENQCGDSYGICSGRVVCFEINMSH
jgi:hypothetical protein